MARFEAVPGGVRVISDGGLVLGEARAFGQHLSSNEALAQLGYELAADGSLASMSSRAKAERANDKGISDGS